MKSKDIEIFEKVQAQLQGLYVETSDVAKKKPDGSINEFKLKFINVVLSEANNVLSEKNRPFKDFELFDFDSLPTNSDVSFILTQYINCLEKYRSENITTAGAGWYWVVDGERSSQRTTPPQKLKY
jgi:hypothetical protein